MPGRNMDCVNETGSYILEWVLNQSGREKSYQIFKHQKETEFTGSQFDNFKIICNVWELIP